MQNPKPPHERLLQQCKAKTDNTAWAVGIGSDEQGNIVWYVYVSNKNKLKKIPKRFEGGIVNAVFAEQPNTVSVATAPTINQ
jgi:hypothetical protein